MNKFDKGDRVLHNATGAQGTVLSAGSSYPPSERFGQEEDYYQIEWDGIDCGLPRWAHIDNVERVSKMK